MRNLLGITILYWTYDYKVKQCSKRETFVNQFVYRDEGRPELAELVANERKRKAELPD